MKFYKGMIPWNKGKKHSLITRLKMKKFHKHLKPWLGKSRSEDTKRKISNSLRKNPVKYWKGKKRPEAAENMIRINKNRVFTVENRKKIGDRTRGEKHYRWKGGITPEYIKIRMSLEGQIWRERVFKRDEFTCQICGERGGRLNANHIKKFSDYPNMRFEIENGITLCTNCHVGLVNGHEGAWESYFNFNLETRKL